MKQPSETELGEMKKYYRQSQRKLFSYAVVGVVVTAVALVGQVWGNGWPWWGWVILLVVGWHGFLGDLINILYLRPRIASAERSAANEANEARVKGNK